MKKMKDLTKVKTRLIELGYIDNEWLDKYLEVIEVNLETRRSRTNTQAHHAIPVNAYWTSNEPYNRIEALKLARKDPVNFVVNLLYKDHLIVHSYLTLCTNLDEVQIRYEAQAGLRKQNSRIGIEASIKKGTNSVCTSSKGIKTAKDDFKSLAYLKHFYSDEEIEDILDL